MLCTCARVCVYSGGSGARTTDNSKGDECVVISDSDDDPDEDEPGQGSIMEQHEEEEEAGDDADEEEEEEEEERGPSAGQCSCSTHLCFLTGSFRFRGTS